MQALHRRLVAASMGMAVGVAATVAPAGAAIDTAAFCAEVPEGSSGFDDIAGTSPATRAVIECLAASGITSGTGPGTYSPSGTVYRDTMATFVARLVDAANELEETTLAALPADAPDAFGDDDASVHEANVDRLAAAGIVAGTGPGTYGPNGPGHEVSRAQMATFLVAAVEYLRGTALPDAPDAFADDDGSVHEANIDKLAALDVVDGTAEGSYAPTASLSRAQMAAFLVRTLALLEADGDIGPLPAPGDAGGEGTGGPADPAEVPPTSLDAELTTSAGVGTALDAGDVLQLCFDQVLADPLLDELGPVLGDVEAVELGDADGTVVRLTQGADATFRRGDGPGATAIAVGVPGAPTCPANRTLEILVTSGPSLVDAGTTAGLQFPALVVTAAEIEDVHGQAWTPGADPDALVDVEAGPEPD